MSRHFLRPLLGELLANQVGNMAVPGRHQLSDHVLFEHSDKELHGVFLPDNRIAAEAHVSSMEQYQQMYKRSIENPEEFWREIAEQFYWHKPPTSFLSYNFNVDNGPIFIKWMEGAQTNICYNVLDRIINERKGENTVAFYWLVLILNSTLRCTNRVVSVNFTCYIFNICNHAVVKELIVLCGTAVHVMCAFKTSN